MDPAINYSGQRVSAAVWTVLCLTALTLFLKEDETFHMY